MDYEQKYNKLVEAVKVLQETNPSDEGIQNWVNDNVPELRESEDEKIRKALINVFATHKDYEMFFGVSVEDIHAWLERQGESALIEEIKRRKELLLSEKEKALSISENLSLGGKIAMLEELLVFAKEKQGEQKPTWSHEDDVMVHDILGLLPVKTRPEYNQRRVDWIKSLKGRVQPVQEWSKEDESMYTRTLGILGKCYIGQLPTKVEEELKWFKSIKDKVQLKPTEWSDEDEEMLKSITATCELAEQERDSSPARHLLEMQLNWLKSLKQRYTWRSSSELDEASYQVGVKRVLENPESYGLTKYNWKPSDEQLYILNWLATNVLGDGVVEQEVSKHLNELYNDLKKL